MSKKDAGPATVRNDEPDRQNRIGGRALEPVAETVRAAALEAIPRVVTVETVTRAIDGLAAELGITRAETVTRIAAGLAARPGRCGQ